MRPVSSILQWGNWQQDDERMEATCGLNEHADFPLCPLTLPSGLPRPEQTTDGAP